MSMKLKKVEVYEYKNIYTPTDISGSHTGGPFDRLSEGGASYFMSLSYHLTYSAVQAPQFCARDMTQGTAIIAIKR